MPAHPQCCIGNHAQISSIHAGYDALTTQNTRRVALYPGLRQYEVSQRRMSTLNCCKVDAA
jgi:hypothetical protein